MTDKLREVPKLLPCPFCGAKPRWYPSQSIAVYEAISCINEDCDVQPETDYGEPYDVATAWNTRAALAAAPQPAPDRETLESIIYNSADAYIEEHDRRAIADALLARGLRLPGDETMAWAVVGEDGEVIPGSIYPTRDEAERVCDYEGERVVPVTIRVVEGGDDAA